MAPRTPARHWLVGRDEAALTALLQRRPDVLYAPSPRTLAELGQRLDRPDSALTALRGLPLPCAQIVQVLNLLDGRGERSDVVNMLALDGVRDLRAFEKWAGQLADLGLIGMAGDRFWLTAGLASVYRRHDQFLALKQLLSYQSSEHLQAVLLNVQQTPGKDKAANAARIVKLLKDPDFACRVLATAPEAFRLPIVHWAATDIQPPNAARDWAIDHGLAYRLGWSGSAGFLPHEVQASLRRLLRIGFDADPPPLETNPVEPDRLAGYAAAAITRFADLLVALLDRLSRTPLATLKSGGVGARVLTATAKALGCSEAELRLLLALADDAGLLVLDAAGWRSSDDAEQWRAEPAPQRVATVLLGWWQLPLTATDARDHQGKPQPALTAARCPHCADARASVLEQLARVPASSAITPRSLLEGVQWRAPSVHLPPDVDPPFAYIVSEAEALGVVASQALTDLGRTLVAEDRAGLEAALAQVLPQASNHALFGADLTAVVSGTPTVGVSRLLDATADRESTGGATVWRFTPGSVRRALDEGHTAHALLVELAAIAAADLPQPLRYLIADVGRQHGSVRVAAATSILRSADEALLKQIANDRSLTALGLRLLAPTVVTAEADTATVLKRLRALGYLPMPDAPLEAPPASGAALPRRRTPGHARGAGVRLDPATVAQALVHVTKTAAHSETEERVAEDAGNLDGDEIRLLAHAIDTQGRVTIDYENQSGRITRRVIAHPELVGDVVYAHCELRADERMFRLDQILSVGPPGAITG